MFVLQLYSISCLNTMSIPFCATYCTLSFKSVKAEHGLLKRPGFKWAQRSKGAGSMICRVQQPDKSAAALDSFLFRLKQEYKFTQYWILSLYLFPFLLMYSTFKTLTSQSAFPSYAITTLTPLVFLCHGLISPILSPPNAERQLVDLSNGSMSYLF